MIAPVLRDERRSPGDTPAICYVPFAGRSSLRVIEVDILCAGLVSRRERENSEGQTSSKLQTPISRGFGELHRRFRARIWRDQSRKYYQGGGGSILVKNLPGPDSAQDKEKDLEIGTRSWRFAEMAFSIPSSSICFENVFLLNLGIHSPRRLRSSQNEIV